MKNEFPLDQTSVFLDFDGTISRSDIGRELAERFGGDVAVAASKAFRAGELSSRECLSIQWKAVVDCTGGDLSSLRENALQIADIDPDFVALVSALRLAGAEVTVVSDGLGFYVHDLLGDVLSTIRGGADVGLFTNAVDFDAAELQFPNSDMGCACSSCGTCKQAPIKEARRRGRHTVLVGDGMSDAKAALVAHRVIATADLLRFCQEFELEFDGFETLSDVATALGVSLS